jgi:PleD family two-component response regulator
LANAKCGIKQDEKLSDIPIIFLTANNDEATISKAYESGGQDFISKPFKASELTSRIKTHLELHEARKELKSALMSKGNS